MNIAISAKMGAGKGVAAKFISTAFGFQVISFADPIKELAKLAVLDDLARNTRAASIISDVFIDRPHLVVQAMQRYSDLIYDYEEELLLYGADGEKPRSFLQNLGSSFRDLYPDCWTSFLINRANEEGGNWVCDDMRYLNEARRCREAGWTLVRVNADDSVRRERLRAIDLTSDRQEHQSEVDLDDFYEWDMEWHNSGSIDDFIKQIAASLRYVQRPPAGAKSSELAGEMNG